MAEDLERYNSPLTGAQVDVALQDMAQRISERYAKGTANGVPVTTGQIGYQDNAKYYAEQAKTDADRAESAVPIGTESAVLWTMAQGLTDSAKATARNNIGAGNPTSTVAGGKNLFNETIVSGGLDWTNGNYGQNNKRLSVDNYVKLSQGSYVINFSGCNQYFICVYDMNKNYIQSESPIPWLNKGTPFTIVGDRYVRFAFKVDDTTVITPSNISNVQLEEGTTATPYEPYYSSNLALTRKQNIVNLLEPTLATTTLNGVTCTNNGDGTYTLNGTATSGVELTLKTMSTDIPSGTYKLVGCPKGGQSAGFNIYANNYYSSTDHLFQDKGEGIIVPINTDNHCVFRIHLNAGTTVNNLVFKPMITENLSATYEDFIEYGHYSQFGELLWSNASNTSAFTQQTINVNTEDYSKLLFVFKEDKDNLHCISTVALKGIQTIIQGCKYQGSNMYPYMRLVTFPSINQIKYSYGYKSTSTNFAITTDDNILIPYQIYGIRQENENGRNFRRSYHSY